jgi:TRAP-type C4-dicarboxylate transport system substrate-binding protein
MECVVVNEDVWQSLPEDVRSQIQEAAQETSQKATEMVLERETTTLEKLKSTGMTVIGPEDGLDVEAFRTSAGKLVSERFGAEYGDLYEAIRSVQ